ncbi:MAG: hypothetical protein K0Q79_1511 [Flavipsychrobacter sp.]|nr:hypothetical protein [Flavipsychrobacter sp.]
MTVLFQYRHGTVLVPSRKIDFFTFFFGCNFTSFKPGMMFGKWRGLNESAASNRKSA